MLVAIILTPALCATILKPVDPAHGRSLHAWLGWFNRGVAGATGGYVAAVGQVVARPLRMLVVFAAICAGVYWLYTNLPSSFVPEEDQGVLITQITLARRRQRRAHAGRGRAWSRTISSTQEKDAVTSVFTTVGFSFGGSGENSAMAFVRLKDYGERKGKSLSASAVAGARFGLFCQIRDAQVFTLARRPSRGSVSRAASTCIWRIPAKRAATR